MSWEYKITELDQYHFEIEYKYSGYFEKLKNTIIQSATIMPPLNEFYTIKRSKYLVIHSDIWQFVSDSLFGTRNKDENHVSKIKERLKEAVQILDNSRNDLISNHQNFINSKVTQKIIIDQYIEIKNLNESVPKQSSFFIKKIKNDFIATKKIVEEDLWQKVRITLKEIETLEFDCKYKEESNLYYKYKECLDRVEKWKSLMPMFYEENECLKLSKKNTFISQDQQIFYYQGSGMKILKKDLPKRKFLLICDQPLGQINKDISSKINEKAEESILIYEFTIIHCLGSRVFHAYSVNENYGLERIGENGIKQRDAYTELFNNFYDCRLNIDERDLTGLSYYTYQLVHDNWSTINKFVGSYYRRFDRSLGVWVSSEISSDIYFLIATGRGNSTFWNNRILDLKLSQCKSMLVPDYSFEELYSDAEIRNYRFLDGNLISYKLYFGLEINGKITFNVNELKQWLLCKIKDTMSFDNILKRLQQKIIADWYSGEKLALFSLELAKNELRCLFEKNQRSFLYVENKIYFFHLFLNDLFNKNLSDYTKDRQIHQFVISKTKEADNPEFGRLAEKEVYSYLINHYNNFNWSGKFQVPVEFFPAFKFEINWHNQHNESFLPYDISIRSQLYEIKIDVKATRGSEDNIFYVSIPELKKVLENPDLYLIARVSMIEEGKRMRGILLNSEMNLNFFQFKNETIDIIKSNLSEWENYYGENSVRFLIGHFEQSIPNVIDELNLSEKFEQYQNSCHAIIRSYFQNKIDQDQETKWLLSKTELCSRITKDPALQWYFDSYKKVAIDQLCNNYSAQLKEYKMGMPE